VRKITTDSFPFNLYYLELYDRYQRVRTTIRRCISEYPHEDAYTDALCKLDAVLTSVVSGKRVKWLVKSLKHDRRIFKRLRAILENEDKKLGEVVERRMMRFLSSLERKAETSKKCAPLVKQIKKFWSGLFYTYDHDRIPRTYVLNILWYKIQTPNHKYHQYRINFFASQKPLLKISLSFFLW
jgi:hypothetical protein